MLLPSHLRNALSLAVVGGCLSCSAADATAPRSEASEPAATAAASDPLERGEARRGDDDRGSSALRRYTRDLLNRRVVGRSQLTIVFVLDGMRPDFITAELTPNLYRLRQSGVQFANGHAVFPTVTRVNSPSIATGYYPERAGIVGNSIYVPEIDPTSDVNTGDWRVLKQLDALSGGRVLLVKSLAERLHAAGKTLAAVSSGSSGSAFLLNHRAPDGVGVLVNGYLEDAGGRVAFPDAVNDAILARFGAAPPTSGPRGNLAPVDWAEAVLRDYILPEVHPDVVLNWLTQPDGAQHTYGAGSPEALEVIRNDDRNIGLVLDKLAELGLREKTNVFVVSDHGFGWDAYQVNLEKSLIDAGLKRAADSDDVVLASSSQTVAIHVKHHARSQIRKIVRHLQAQPFTGLVFTRGEGDHHGHDVEPEGWVPGTFSLDLVHLDNPERGADIVLTFDWTSEKNAFGVVGTDTTLTGGATGPRAGNASGHGSMSPWTVRNTWFAWGADFKDGIVNRVPSSNVDIAPTVLALQGLDASRLDGRVLVEAIEGGPDFEKVPVETRTFTTEAGDYRAVIQITEVGHQRYIDKSFRLP